MMQNLREILLGINVVDCLVHFYHPGKKKDYQGWLNKLREQEIDIKVDKSSDIALGEKFLFEIVTLGREIKFEAITQIILGDILRFSVTSTIQILNSYKIVQKRIEKMPVKIKFKRYYFDAEAIRISPNGIQLVLSDDFELDDKLNLNIITPHGVIDVDALVIKCELKLDEEGFYTLSLEFLNMRRTEKIRWLKYFLSSERILIKD